MLDWSVRSEPTFVKFVAFAKRPGKFQNSTNAFADLDLIALPSYNRGYSTSLEKDVLKDIDFQQSYSNSKFQILLYVPKNMNTRLGLIFTLVSAV